MCPEQLTAPTRPPHVNYYRNATAFSPSVVYIFFPCSYIIFPCLSPRVPSDFRGTWVHAGRPASLARRGVCAGAKTPGKKPAGLSLPWSSAKPQDSIPKQRVNSGEGLFAVAVPPVGLLSAGSSPLVVSQPITTRLEHTADLNTRAGLNTQHEVEINLPRKPLELLSNATESLKNTLS